MTEASVPIAIPKKDQSSLTDEYSRLVLEKEFLISHRSLQLRSEYMLKVGAKEYSVFKKKVEMMMAKRKLALIRSYTNRGDIPDIKRIDDTIEKEFTEYSDRIKEQAEQIDALLKVAGSEQLSKEESTELRKMYNKIVRSLHPDLNPSVSENDLGRYQMATEAYRRGDLECIRAIYLTLDNEEMPFINDIESKIVKLRSEIEEIKRTFPFDKIDFLNDPDAIERRNDELDRLMESYSNELSYYNEMISRMEAAS